jgi:hypothetical protein
MINLPLPGPNYKWQSVGMFGSIGWSLFFLGTMWMYWTGTPYLQNAHLIPHEAGHLLLSHTGNETITVFAGTAFELLVPLALTTSFAWRGHTYGTAFCLFMFFNAFMGVGTYMADARRTHVHARCRWWRRGLRPMRSKATIGRTSSTGSA